MLGALLILLVVVFAAAAVFYCAPVNMPARTGMSAAVLAVLLVPFLPAQYHKRGRLAGAAILAAIFTWYWSLAPKMHADWQKDVARLPEIDIKDHLLTVRGIRNFHYRTDTDYDVDYLDKTFDLDTIRSVDLFLSYWGTTAIAHTIMSFGFANGEYLPISIETRKEAAEEYSAVQGFFKKYELYYVLADERDVIGLRVNHRKEDVYLYRLRISPSEARAMLLDYMKTVEKLEHQAVFYNALTTNCTTSILPHIRAYGTVSFNWALIANGYLDRWRYEQGVWGFEIPFEEFRRRSNINERVRLAGTAGDFSARIREGLPSIKPDMK